MDIRTQRGLIGELLVVERLDPIIGLATAIDRWRGPFDELHDIIDDDWHIEVKSYADEPPRVRISQVEQLDANIDPKLSIAGVHLMGSSKGKTLPNFIDHFIQLADENGVKTLALERLNAAGWCEDDRTEYSSRFIVGRMVLCPIHLGTSVFPAKLLCELPHSVDKVTYRLALNELFQIRGDADSSWRLVCSPGDWLDSDLDFTVKEQIGFENPPRFSLLVETEQIYRELIHSAYKMKFGTLWWQNVPGRVQESIRLKISKWNKEGAINLESPSRRYWDACTTGDLYYAMTVKDRWPKIFEGLMDISKGNFQKHWEFFSNLRNTTFHSNEPLSEAHLEEGIAATKIVRAIASNALKQIVHERSEHEH